MIRPQPIRRRPRLRARITRAITMWLTGHPTHTNHQTWRY